VVHSPGRPRVRPPAGGDAIASSKKKTVRKASKRAVKPVVKRAARAKPPRAARARRPVASASQSDHPLGEGVADGFALRRLKAPARLSRTPKKAVRELGWAAFGEEARSLAARIGARYHPDIVLGIVKGGVFVGGALASALQADFQTIRLEKRRRDTTAHSEPAGHLPDLTGKKVLVVDDVCASGSTLAKGRAVARKAGARQIQTAVLVKRPTGAKPDWFAFETDELMLFGWDYELQATDQVDFDPGEAGA
jgi:hypoxanthine phosphoribosyltransferase